MTIEARLEQLGITLTTPPAPIANYVPFAAVGDLVHTSRARSAATRTGRSPASSAPAWTPRPVLWPPGPARCS